MTKKISTNERDVIERAMFEISRKIGGNIDLCQDSGYLRNELKYGVNWCATGTQTPLATKEYADKMLKAAKVCDWINVKNYEIDYQLDEDVEFDREHFIEAVNKYVDIFEELIGNK